MVTTPLAARRSASSSFIALVGPRLVDLWATCVGFDTRCPSSADAIQCLIDTVDFAEGYYTRPWAVPVLALFEVMGHPLEAGTITRG
jgi:hypothetical protein